MSYSYFICGNINQKQTSKEGYNTLIINIVILLCVETHHIYSGIMSHFLYLKISSKMYCVVYTGMYDFMKKIPVYIYVIRPD